MKLISREKLEYIAKEQLKYPLHDAEKDYFLALTMELIANSALAKILVFKGGTAIHHCYLNQLRFSEDLDFTSKDKDLNMNDLKSLFRGKTSFEVKKEYKSEYTLKIERLKYYGVLDTPNSIKVEVDTHQNVILEPVEKTYNNVWSLDFDVYVMNPIEICAEKIRACNDRFRYRDFYDLYMLVIKEQLKINEAIELLPQKEIRKPLSKDNIMRNLKLAIDELSSKADTIVYKENINASKLERFFENLEIPLYEANV